MKVKNSILLAVAVLALGSQALADVCKEPKVKVVNDKKQTIKVKKIEYFDDCNKKWRTEDVSDTEIASGASKTFTDNLEYVEGCKITKFKLYRAVRQDTGSKYGEYSWGGELVPDEGAPICKTNVLYTIHAHD